MQQLIDNDFDRLAAAVRAIGIGVVMIDGCTLVGKTTLSRALAERLRGVSIDTDDFIERRRGVFVEALRTGELKAAVDAALTLPKIVFVSGVCAREIADRAALNPVLFVYVQRNTTAASRATRTYSMPKTARWPMA